MDFSQTQTAAALMRAFAGESQAQMRYTLAAQLAEQQQLPLIGQVFKFTAKQERTHAGLFVQRMQQHGLTLQQITADYPVDPQDDLAAILDSSAQHERAEADEVYPAFAKTAQDEGFLPEAQLFTQLAAIERSHSERFAMFAQMMQDGTLFREDGQTMWMCMHCGHLHVGTEPPKSCPVCSAVQGWAVRRRLAPYTAE